MPREMHGIEFRKPMNLATEVARHLREQIIHHCTPMKGEVYADR